MSYCGTMTSSKPRRKIENEFIFERLRKNFSRAFGGLLWEITENYKRVGRLLTSVWILFSSYICVLQYTVQNFLHTVETDLLFCESHVIYGPSASDKLYHSIFTLHGEKSSLPILPCMCNKKTSRFQQIQTTHNAKLVTSWLRRKGIRVAFDDVTKWNDGTLMWEVLKRISNLKDVEHVEDLCPGKRIENWSLVGAVIKRQFPGLIENELILRCLVASDLVRIHHIIYILTRIMYAHRKIWKIAVLRWVLWISNALKGVLRPRFVVSGPGILYAKINMKNEFVVRTLYECPPFTIEIEDANGEKWREASNNARLGTTHDEEYQSVGYPGLADNERPVEIVKVSRFLYKILYVVHEKGKCKITIRPGINKGGQIHRSPFLINVGSGAHRRQHKLKKSHSEPRPFIVDSTRRKQSFVQSNSLSIEENMPDQPCKGDEVHGNSNGNIVRNNSDAINSEDENDDSTSTDSQTQETTPEPRVGLRKMTAQFLRNIGTGISTVSSRVISTMSIRGDGSESSNTPVAKRRTHASVYAGVNMNGRSAVGNGLSVPSSRNFKIRKVTIHRYLNKPMPSLEEYFFGSTGLIFDNEECTSPRDAGKRWGNISSLLRAKMRMTNGSSKFESVDEESKNEGEKTKNWEASSDVRKRRTRLRRSDNIYQKPKLRSRHSSDDLFWRKSMVEDSSSSSESYDVFDNDIPEEPTKAVKSVEQQVSIEALNIENLDKPRKESLTNGVRFQHIFREADGAADILLQNASLPPKPDSRTFRSFMQRKSTETTKSVPDTTSRKSSIQSTDSTRATRRSGYANFRMNRPAAKTEQNQPVNTNDSSPKRTYLAFANEAADKLIEMAKKEVVISVPRTST